MPKRKSQHLHAGKKWHPNGSMSTSAARQPPARTGRCSGRLFWLASGVVWLLGNLGLLPTDGYVALIRFWPLLLIAVGIDIIFTRRSAILGGLIGAAVVAISLGLVIIGPSLGLDDNARLFGMPLSASGGRLHETHLSTGVNGVDSADVSLELGWEPVSVYGLSSGSDLLLEADMVHSGEMVLDRSGSNVLLSRQAEVGLLVEPQRFLSDAKWDIGLNPDVPTALYVSARSGSADLNLSDLTLTGLEVDGGSGSIDLYLPPTQGDFNADLDIHSGSFDMVVPEQSTADLYVSGGSGSFELEIGSGSSISLYADTASGSSDIVIGQSSDVALDLDTGSGSVNVDVPSDVGLRVEAWDDGSGSLNLPGGMQLIESYDDEDTGLWESEGFDNAEHQVVITVSSAASGSININR
ncbi:MAG: hypothetical protein JXJ17_13235 [Anaerolineae bacterium]|nr:hypothetical protein [Anaerolineae bacterium]